jgi:DNA repair protein RecN (Recombination protein N)
LLIELAIQNFALIDGLRLELGAGLNVLTGETGAGKSIIIDAVNLVLGGRASVEVIRDPADKARIEGIFALPPVDALKQLLDELGVEPDEDGLLILSREVSRNGRNLCRINGQTFTLTNYRRVGQFLVDLHGQHEHQSLLNPEQHLELLDRYGGEAIAALRRQSAGSFLELQMVIREIERWQKDEQALAQRQDLLTYQVQEIAAAHLVVGEEEELTQARIILQNAETLAQRTGLAYQLTYAGERQQNSAYEMLGKAVAELKAVSGLDDRLQTIGANLEAVLYQTEEIARDLRAYLDQIDPDPKRLAELEERLDLLRQLKRKYGNSLAEILEYAQEAAAELDKLVHSEAVLTDLQERRQQLAQTYAAAAEALSEERRKAAIILEAGINQELAYLGMPQARFAVHFQRRETPSALGQDMIEFLLSANPGEPLKPLARIASGGEMSRVMLAFKTVLARVDQVPTLIFDEIDTGIGGRSLEAVAARLSEVAGSHQVICVTHAAPIAGWADRHFLIEKQVEQDRTTTRTSVLLPEERIIEISRMLDGDTESQVSRQHALELLERAKARKMRKN